MLRVAMWCTMLGTNKHQDNIQRILTKADLDKLKTANAKEKVITAEHQLQGAWPIVAKSTVEDQTHSYKCLWQTVKKDRPVFGWQTKAQQGNQVL